jgi:hypothetical protein
MKNEELPRKFEDIDCSVRLMNILRDNKIRTVDEALIIPKWRYYSWRNMGKKSMLELEVVLSPYPEFPLSVFNISFSTPTPTETELLTLMRKYDVAMNERERVSKRMLEIETSFKGKMEHLFAAYCQVVSDCEKEQE